MKIKFLTGDVTPHYNINPKHKVISDTGYRDNQFLDLDFYSSIKALEKNTKFETEVKNTRQQLGLPDEGYPTINEYIKAEYPWLLKKAPKSNLVISVTENKDGALTKLAAKFNLPQDIAEQIHHIVYASCVIAPPNKISHGPFIINEDPETESTPWCFQISISSPVTKNKLISYIENHWTAMSEQINKLEKGGTVRVSDRDLRIVELRDVKKRSYSRIADDIIIEFALDNRDGSINEDSVKTAYKRAKNKILSFGG